MTDDFLLRIRATTDSIESQQTETTQNATAQEKLTSAIPDVLDMIEPSKLAASGDAFQTGQLTPMPELLTTDVVPKLVTVSQPTTGSVSWDSILKIKEELLKDNPDWQSIFQTLQNLSPADRIATLEEMQKEGDLRPFIQNLPPEAHQALAGLLTPLVQAETPNCDPQLTDVLNNVFDVMNDYKGTFADTVRAMGSYPTTSAFQTNALINILDFDNDPRTRLSSLISMKKAGEAGPPSLQYFPQPSDMGQLIDRYFDNFLNGTQTIPPPALSEAFAANPDWAEQKLIDLDKSGKMGEFVTRMQQNGDNIGGALAQSIADASLNPDLSHAFQQLFQAMLNQKSPMADDVVRSMMDSMQDQKTANGTPLLNTLPPSLLIEMKLILQNGDDTGLDAAPLDLVNNAYNVATGHAPITQEAPSSSPSSTAAQTLPNQLMDLINQYSSSPIAGLLVSSFSSTILSQLQQVSPQDQISALQQLQQTGTPPNTALDQLVKVLSDNGQNTQSMGGYLVLLANDAKTDPAAGQFLTQAYNDLKALTTDPAKLKALIENLVNNLDSQTLAAIPPETLQAMQSDLSASGGDAAVLQKLQDAISPLSAGDTAAADATAPTTDSAQTVTNQLMDLINQYGSSPIAELLVSSFSSSILNTLQQVPPADQISALQQLQQTGTPPNTAFDQLVKLLSDNGQNTQSMGGYLALLANDAKTDPAAGQFLTQAYNDLKALTTDSSKLATLVGNLVNNLDPQTLAALPPETLQTMQSDLSASGGDAAVLQKLQDAISAQQGTA